VYFHWDSMITSFVSDPSHPIKVLLAAGCVVPYLDFYYFVYCFSL